MTAANETKVQIEQAVSSLIDEVPSLRQLKLVFSLELRGRGDTQQYRVELPGPIVTKTIPTDARVNVEMRREFFNAMVAEGAKVADWREAFHYGQAKATGVSQILQLIERVVSMHEERNQLRRASH
jgi:hypothetical protein